MYIHNRARLIKALKKESRKKRYGLSAGHINMFIKDAIEDLDGCLESESGRNSFEFVTGIKTKRVGSFIFLNETKRQKKANQAIQNGMTSLNLRLKSATSWITGQKITKRY